MVVWYQLKPLQPPSPTKTHHMALCMQEWEPKWSVTKRGPFLRPPFWRGIYIRRPHWKGEGGSQKADEVREVAGILYRISALNVDKGEGSKNLNILQTSYVDATEQNAATATDTHLNMGLVSEQMHLQRERKDGRWLTASTLVNVSMCRFTYCNVVHAGSGMITL